MKNPAILVFSAHAADFCSRCGGTIAKYVRRGSRVRVVDLTFGERGESPQLWSSKEQMTIEKAKEIRQKEAEKAAKILGTDIRFLDFDDYPLIIDKTRCLKLVAEIREMRPNIILTHWINAPLNPDHGVTGRAVIEARRYAEVDGVLPETAPVSNVSAFMFEATAPRTEFTRFNPNVYIDITDVYEIKMRALTELESQPLLPKWYEWYAKYRGLQARLWSRQETIEYAECYQRFTPQVGTEFL